MKEKFIKSTIILVIGGIITKLLGMIIRIIMTRFVGVNGIGLYMLILPTFNLFITLATMSFPVAISKIVAEDSRNNKKLVLGMIPVALIFNLLLIIIIIVFAPFISSKLLHNSLLYLPIFTIAFTLPFITISSILRGYFFGKQKMLPQVISNIGEQLVRIILIIIISPILLKRGIIYAVSGLIGFNILSETTSIIILFLFAPRDIKINKNDLKYDQNNTKDILNIAIPTTMGRIISAIGLFLEPIIITYVLLKLGYSSSYITFQYGILSGYVIPIVSMPSFLSGAISTALLPVITKYHKLNKPKLVNKKIKQAIILSLVIGESFTLIFFFKSELVLKLIFNDIRGSKLLKIASIIYFISYIESPIICALQAMDKSKVIMISNIFGIIIRTISLFIFTYLDIGVKSVLYASLIYYIFIISYHIIALKKQ